MDIPLVVAEYTGMCRRDLRRFTFSSETGGHGHDAKIAIGEISDTEAAKLHGDNWPHDDGRWPLSCETCGYVFQPSDHWQRNDNRIYQHPSGHRFTLWGMETRDVPPGTMVRIAYYDEYSQHPDGVESWLVVLPDGGQWITSQSAKGGGLLDSYRYTSADHCKPVNLARSANRLARVYP